MNAAEEVAEGEGTEVADTGTATRGRGLAVGGTRVNVLVLA